ncbi:sensor histidine kinase [Adhaeribacter terreus]|uniref:Sensor histidine kinase n=1 Tax=Adhaeribacter terreus TaxID=529703 RepID=A0ABW0E7A9_9BACT
MPFIFFWTDNWEEAANILSAPFYWVFCILFGGLYFFNYYYLVPEFYQQKKFGKFWAILLALFIAFYFLKPFNGMLRQILQKTGVTYPPISLFRIDPVACILFIILVSLGLALRVIKQWRVTEKRALQAETEKANAELSFLKAQINPHFLFNTLNNIYSLSVDQHPETSASIMKLSNIMRYITDEATKDFVPLEDEVSCIADFIDLHKLRLGKNMTVDFTVSGTLQEKQISPLILMTYIENVFKYGISSHEEARITINLEVDDETIHFFCQNKIFAQPRVIERTGVGLKNTEKRLQHLYPDKHNLTISSNNGFYTVDLTLFA